MKNIIITLFSLLTINAFAQNDKQEQQTLFGSDQISLRAYASLNHKSIQLNNQIGLMAGGEFSFVLNHKFNFGIIGYGMFSDIQSNFVNLQNETYNYNLGMGGIKLEPVFLSNSAIHFTTPIEIGMGGISLNKNGNYNNQWESSYKEYDVYGYIEPGIRAELNLFRNLRLSGGVGYQFTDVINLTETASHPLNGFVANASLKLGWF